MDDGGGSQPLRGFRAVAREAHLQRNGVAPALALFSLSGTLPFDLFRHEALMTLPAPRSTYIVSTGSTTGGRAQKSPDLSRGFLLYGWIRGDSNP